MTDRFGFHNGGVVSSSITLSGCSDSDLLLEFRARFSISDYSNISIEYNAGINYIISDNTGVQTYVDI